MNSFFGPKITTTHFLLTLSAFRIFVGEEADIDELNNAYCILPDNWEDLMTTDGSSRPWIFVPEEPLVVYTSVTGGSVRVQKPEEVNETCSSWQEEIDAIGISDTLKSVKRDLQFLTNKYVPSNVRAGQFFAIFRAVYHNDQEDDWPEFTLLDPQEHPELLKEIFGLER